MQEADLVHAKPHVGVLEDKSTKNVRRPKCFCVIPSKCCTASVCLCFYKECTVQSLRKWIYIKHTVNITLVLYSSPYSRLYAFSRIQKREARLRWFEHMMRRDEEKAISIVPELVVEGERGQGRPKRRWEDCTRKDMEMMGLKGEDVYGRSIWRSE